MLLGGRSLVRIASRPHLRTSPESLIILSARLLSDCPTPGRQSNGPGMQKTRWDRIQAGFLMGT